LEGELMQTYVTVERSFDPPRTFTAKPGVRVNGYAADKPGRVIKTATWSTPSTAQFDSVARIEQRPDAAIEPSGRVLHVVSGALEGLWINASAVVADTSAPPVGQEVIDAAVEAAVAAYRTNVVTSIRADVDAALAKL
jgi:hypothetical protein